MSIYEMLNDIESEDTLKNSKKQKSLIVSI